MSKPKYDELMSLTQADLAAKIRTGELIVDKSDREEFYKFAAFAPGSEGRKKFVEGAPASNADAPGAPPADSGNDQPGDQPNDQPPPNDAPQSDAPPADNTPPPDSDNPTDTLETLGYKSEAEAVQGLKTLRGLVESQQGQLDRFNGERGQLGRTVKKLKDQLATTNKMIEELRKSPPAGQQGGEPLKRPERPRRPNPKDFDDGAYGEEFQAAQADYDAKMVEYETSMDEYLANFKPKWAQDLEGRLNTASERADKAFEFAENTSQNENQNAHAKAWNDLWSKAVPELQKEFNLGTTMNVKAINNAASVFQNPNATQADKTNAKAYWDALTDADKANYQRITKAIHARYRFDEGVPIAKYRTWPGALTDAGLQKEFSDLKKAGLTPEEEARLRKERETQNQQSATVPPGSSMPRGDDRPTDSDPDNVKQEFAALTQEYHAAVKGGPKSQAGWERSPKFRRYVELRKKFNLRTSSSMEKAAAAAPV